MALPMLKSYDGINDDDSQTGVLSTTTIASDDHGHDVRVSDHQDVQQSNNLFSIDLEAQCVRHFRFLKSLHEAGITQRGTTPKSLRRYILWLQMIVNMQMEQELVEEHGNATQIPPLLVPPSDVAWLWHCHRLAPLNYKEYIQNYRRRTLETVASRNSIVLQEDCSVHHPASDPNALESSEISRQTWAQHYPNEPFDLDPWAEDASAGVAIVSEQESSTRELLEGFDLLSSAKAQAEFYWQIQPLFDGNDRMVNFASAATNYHRFLELFRRFPNLTFKLVPTYEIDLLWHTHMTAGTIHDYISDCERICGKVIDHDDNYGNRDRGNGSILQESFERTAELWDSTYNDNTYAARGGYRGPPPSNYHSAPDVRGRANQSSNHRSIDGITTAKPN